MHVFEAIESRRSMRAFTDQPVTKEQMQELMQICQRSPSGTNTQPWHVYLCAGDVKERLSQAVLAEAMAGGGVSYDGANYYPARWQDNHRDRRRTIGWQLYGLLGIQKGEKEKMAKQSGRNFTFFDAPVGLFVTVDSYLLYGSWADAGMYAQTVMLAARGMGLHTCPQAAWVPFEAQVKQHLDIPDDQSLVTGMSIGYADMDKIENSLITEREPMDDIVHFRGFD